MYTLNSLSQKSHIRNLIVIVLLLISFAVRFFSITKVPPSLYWEEVALGYDAYSLLNTGRDHHGHWFPIVALESFGDYKPALYAYTIIPFILIFGLNSVAVRLPSVLAGVVLTYVTGLIARELIQPKNSHDNASAFFIQLAAMIFMIFSPWALQFSRGGWEVNLATTLITSGVYFGIKAQKANEQKNTRKVFLFYVTCALVLIAAMYTYHATRIIGPAMGLVLAVPLLLRWRIYLKNIVVLAALSIVLVSPLAFSIFKPQVNHRLQETSTFNTLSEIEDSNTFTKALGNQKLGKLMFHRYFFYARTVVSNMFSHLRIDYLFISGDHNPRHSSEYFGLFYPFDSVFLLLGIYFLLRNWNKSYHILWIWWLISVFPASLTTGVPHALRTLPSMPTWIILMAMGAYEIRSISLPIFVKKVAVLFLYLILVAQWFVFGHFYLFIYPSLYSQEWQYGYQQMIDIVNLQKKNNEKIYITREQGRPAMYYWFFSKTPPYEVQLLEPTAKKDQAEFLEYKNIQFVNELSGQEKGLIASSVDQSKHFPLLKPIITIQDLSGKAVWFVYRVE